MGLCFFLAEAAAATNAESDGGGAFVGFLIIAVFCWICFAIGKESKKSKGVDISGTIRPR